MKIIRASSLLNKFRVLGAIRWEPPETMILIYDEVVITSTLTEFYDLDGNHSNKREVGEVYIVRPTELPF